MALRRALPLFVVLTAVFMYAPVRAMDSIESQVFGFINGERSSRLVEHSGLLAVARAHSQEMASRGGLDHDDADARVASAPPDPAEANGAPDDGFAVAAWCENVTYTTGVPASEAARRIYEQWHGSGAHQRCMTNSAKNVAAVGVYYDGNSWWATFIAEADSTPPGGAQPEQRAAPADSAKPKSGPSAGTAPSNAQQTTSAPSSNTAADSPALPVTERASEPSDVGDPSSDGATTVVRSAQSALSDQAAPLRYEIQVGRWDTIRALPRAARPRQGALPGTAILATLIGLASLIGFRRSTKRLPEMERRDVVPLPEVELVGAVSLHT